MHIAIFGGTSFSPLSLTPEFWVRSDLGVADEGAGAVSAWVDQSGNGRNVSDGSVGTRRPTLTSSEVNGHAALVFDGSSDALQSSVFTEVVQPYHVFVVFSAKTWTGFDCLFALKNEPNEPLCYQITSSPNIEHFGGSVDDHAVSPTLDTYYLLQSFFNGAGSFQALNNDASVSGANIGTKGMNEITLCARQNATSPGNFGIAEMAIYGSQIAGSDLTSLKSYFNTRYSLW